MKIRNQPFRVVDDQLVEFEPATRETIYGLIAGSPDADNPTLVSLVESMDASASQTFGQAFARYMRNEQAVYRECLWAMTLL